jgi:hypothetical protein
LPARQIIGHHTPSGTGSRAIAHSIEDLSQTIQPLWGIFRHQRQAEGNRRRFFITHITGLSFSFVHFPSLAASVSNVHNTL